MRRPGLRSLEPGTWLEHVSNAQAEVPNDRSTRVRLGARSADERRRRGGGHGVGSLRGRTVARRRAAAGRRKGDDDVFVFRSTGPPVSERVVEPYFGYACQDLRSNPGEAVAPRALADAVASSAADRLLVVGPTVVATHGPLVAGAMERIVRLGPGGVHLTDTLPVKEAEKLRVCTVSALLADVADPLTHDRPLDDLLLPV